MRKQSLRAGEESLCRWRRTRFSAFLRAGLIQRLIITRVPVLIGDGISLFGTLPRDIKLEHVDTTPNQRDFFAVASRLALEPQLPGFLYLAEKPQSADA